MSTPPKQEVKKKKIPNRPVYESGNHWTNQNKDFYEKFNKHIFQREEKQNLHYDQYASRISKTKQNLQHIEKLQFYFLRTLLGSKDFETTEKNK